MKVYENDAAQLLPEILRLSQNMHQQAELSMWDQVRLQEVRRQKLIDVCFPLDGSIRDKEEAADQIRSIIDLDRRIVGMLEQSRQEIGAELGRLHQGRHATRQYRAVGQ